MRAERLTLSGNPGALVTQLRHLVPDAVAVSRPVAEIIARVRSEGDEALTRYTSQFDLAGGDPEPLRVTEAELDSAAKTLEPELRHGLDQAIANVGAVAEAAQRAKASAEKRTLFICTLFGSWRSKTRPVSRVENRRKAARRARPSMRAGVRVLPLSIAGFGLRNADWLLTRDALF